MTINDALMLHRAGRFSEAERAYRQILAAEPGHYHALHFYGVLRAQLGDMQASVELVKRSIELKGDDALAHFHLAAAYRALNRPAEAAASFAQSAALKPDFAEAHAGHAAMLIELGAWQAALDAADRALALKNGFYDAEVYRSRALIELNRPEAALETCERAAAINPEGAECHANRAIALQALKRFDEALAACDSALARDPVSVSALNTRANLLLELDRSAEAMESFQRAMAADPNSAYTYYNYGSALLGMRKWQAAIAAFDSAIALKPDYGEALYNRCTALWELGREDECLVEFARALAINPDLGMAASRLFYEKARRCDWRDYDKQIADLKRFCIERRLADPMAMLAAFDDPALHLKAAETKAGTAQVPAFQGARVSHDRLRIAYLSPDFREHPVGWQIVDILERHDRARFEVFAISVREGPDSPIRTRLKGACDHFEEAGERTDRGLARRIGELGIDIAVDLGGYTQKARTQALAWRPAPVSVEYLGYAGTTGADYVDYLIADAIAIPSEHDCFFSEKIVRLPHTFFPADTVGRSAAPAPSREAEGLPRDGFVFCSFNASYKITPPLFDIWMRLIKAIPNAVLWLRIDSPEARANLVRQAELRGVEPSRLVFSGRVSRADHIARLALADLFLDSTPYNAHTTCNDALWAGLPVLTTAGKSFAARVAASMLTTSGLGELIAPNLMAYEAMALALANHPERLAAYSEHLNRTRAQNPLFDMAGLTTALERAYQKMWERFEAGGKPESFSVSG